MGSMSKKMVEHDTMVPLQDGHSRYTYRQRVLLHSIDQGINLKLAIQRSGYIDFSMLDIIIRLAQDFHAQQKQLYMVGGTVRDVLLQRGQSADADLATDAHPDEIKRLVAPTRPSAVVLVGERFGTVRLLYESNIVEITTFRTERYNPESRKPEVCFGNDLMEDLRRRDFTINAMARDLLNGNIIDPFNGRQDLEAHILRAVGDEPDKRFDEDPLRLLRGVRFAAQLNFTLEAETH